MSDPAERHDQAPGTYARGWRAWETPPITDADVGDFFHNPRPSALANTYDNLYGIVRGIRRYTKEQPGYIPEADIPDLALWHFGLILPPSFSVRGSLEHAVSIIGQQATQCLLADRIGMDRQLNEGDFLVVQPGGLPSPAEMLGHPYFNEGVPPPTREQQGKRIGIATVRTAGGQLLLGFGDHLDGQLFETPVNVAPILDDIAQKEQQTFRTGDFL